MWYATRPATLSRFADLAEAFAQIAGLALGAVAERDNLNRAVAARHRVGLAHGIWMTRRQLTADQAFALLKRDSQNTHVKLRAIAQTVIQTGDLPVGTEGEARDTAATISRPRRGPAGTFFPFRATTRAGLRTRAENAFLPPDTAA